jgi:hypothetical protein
MFSKDNYFTEEKKGKNKGGKEKRSRGGKQKKE